MPTQEAIRVANWAKPENAELRKEIALTVLNLRAAAKRGVVGADRATKLANRLEHLRNKSWADDVRWWLKDYREAIASLLRAKTPAELLALYPN